MDKGSRDSLWGDTMGYQKEKEKNGITLNCHYGMGPNKWCRVAHTLVGPIVVALLQVVGATYGHPIL